MLKEVLKKQTEEGITLVALVITVIVMLILAGVGISAIISGEGLFSKTKQAADKYNNEAEKEAQDINGLINKIGIYNEEENEEKSNANAPELATGMAAVKLSIGTGNATVIEVINPTTDTSWYNYTTKAKQWANAITKNTEGQVTGYWVWIPRYEYKIKYVDETDKSKGGTIDVKFIPITQTVPDEGYLIHPAFVGKRAAGSTVDYQNGEWDKDISGFWVAKFEAGYAGGGKSDTNNKVTAKDTTLKYSGTYASITNYNGAITSGSTIIKYPVFLGKTYSYNRINASDIYKLSQALNDSGNPYGFNEANADTHLMKNSEWGAVAYLSHSQYGVNGQNEVYINNVNFNEKVSTINGITGYVGTSVDAGVNNSANTTLEDSITNGGVTSYAWYTINGQKASSNNNITGVYDLSGGAYEFAAGYINNTAGATNRNNYASALVVGGATSTKYATVHASNSTDTGETNYNSNIGRYGDAIREISREGSGFTGWNGDYSRFPYSTDSFLVRGGHYANGASTGLFYFNTINGNSLSYGFRVCVFVGV